MAVESVSDLRSQSDFEEWLSKAKVHGMNLALEGSSDCKLDHREMAWSACGLSRAYGLEAHQ